MQTNWDSISCSIIFLYIQHIQGAPIKNNHLEKFCISVMVARISANIRVTHLANFIQTAIVVQEIQQFKLYSSLFM